MNQNYKYPPDTSWIRAGRFRRGWQWGAASIVLSIAPFAVWALIGFQNDRGLSLACWLIGLIVGLCGLRERGAARSLAWVGLLMNICIPLVGWILAPLLVGLMMSRSFS